MAPFRWNGPVIKTCIMVRETTTKINCVLICLNNNNKNYNSISMTLNGDRCEFAVTSSAFVLETLTWQRFYVLLCNLIPGLEKTKCSVINVHKSFAVLK